MDKRCKAEIKEILENDRKSKGRAPIDALVAEIEDCVHHYRIRRQTMESRRREIEAQIIAEAARER